VVCLRTYDRTGIFVDPIIDELLTFYLDVFLALYEWREFDKTNDVDFVGVTAFL